jgi:predicted NUDIX family NTP pyrophosphohydrolase
MRQSAGTLLYRVREGETEVLLIHASGNYNRHAPWGIPKGLPDAGEDLEATARRETWEETGVKAGELKSLDWIEYRTGRKRVYAFAGPAPSDAAPLCASWEVDRAEFVAWDQARRLIHPDQAPFLDRLEELLKPT